MPQRTTRGPVSGGAASVLQRRRGAVQQTIAVRKRGILESGDMVVPCPADDRLLTDLLTRVRSDTRHRRSGEYLHVSDLLGKCQRMDAIVYRNDLRHPVERLSLMDALTFAQGDAIHDTIKARSVIASPDTVWGKWKCKCGHLHHDDPCLFSEIDTTEICPYCETPTDEYVEVPMFNEEIKVVGNPDLLLYLREVNAFHVCELKSLAESQFKELVRPKPDHVLQVVFYWYLMRELGYRLTDRVSVFYVTKGYTFRGDPYLEFMIDPVAELHRLDDLIESARELKRAKEGGELPPRVMCPSPDAPKARACHVAQLCFEGGISETTEVDIAELFGEPKPAARTARVSRSRR